MNTRTATVLTGSRPRFVAEVLPETASLETKQLVAYGQKRHWQEIGYLGQAPMPTETVNLGDWLLEPAHLSQRPVPGWVLNRVRDLHAEGFNPRFVLAHEVTNLLPAPPKPKKELWRDVVRPGLVAAKPKLEAVGTGMVKASEKVLPIAWEVTKTAAKVTWVAAQVTAVVGVGLMGAVAAAAMAIDPALIAITDDDSWISIGFWFDDGK